MPKKGRLKPKSKEYIQEAVDIVMNTENDDAALSFLKETLDNDFPDLELGKMDLHEAIKVLGNDRGRNTGRRKTIENLNDSLEKLVKSRGKKKNKGTQGKPKKASKNKTKRNG